MKLYNLNFGRLFLNVPYGTGTLHVPKEGYGRIVRKSRKWKATQIPSSGEWINKTMVCPYKAVINNSKERDRSICIGMKRKDILSEKK